MARESWKAAFLAVAIGCAISIILPSPADAQAGVITKLLPKKPKPKKHGSEDLATDSPMITDDAVGLPRRGRKDWRGPNHYDQERGKKPKAEAPKGKRHSHDSRDFFKEDSWKDSSDEFYASRATMKRAVDRCKMTLSNFVLGVAKSGFANELAEQIEEEFEVDESAVEVVKLVALTPKNCFLSFETFISGQLQGEIAKALRDNPDKAEEVDKEDDVLSRL